MSQAIVFNEPLEYRLQQRPSAMFRRPTRAHMAGNALGTQVAAQIQQSLQVGVSVEEHRCVTGRPQETTAPHRAQQNQNIHS